MDSFYFSVYGLVDRGQLKLAGFRDYRIASNSSIEVTRLGRSLVVFSGSSDLHKEKLEEELEEQSRGGTPNDLAALSVTQGKHAVSFLFENTSSWALTYSVPSGAGGRDLLFAGLSPIVCP